MKLQPVTSSQIAAIGYDPETHTLGIEFKSGGVYHYSHFTPEDWEAFQSADSVGSYFYRHIKPFPEKYPYTKVEMVEVTDWTHPSADSVFTIEGGLEKSRAEAAEYLAVPEYDPKLAGKTYRMPRHEFENLPEFEG